MRITEEIGIFWQELTRRQKLVVAGIIVLVLGLMLSGWIDSLYANREVRRHERAAAVAKRDSEQALATAVKLARQIEDKAEELKQLEAELNEKTKKLDSASRDTRDARAEYDRAVREPRTDVPDTDTLCRELAELGYRCE